MRKRVLTATGALATAAALVAFSPSAFSGDLGTLVAKDTGKGKSPVAVATATIRDPGKLTFTIATKPKRKMVDWIYTTDCVKDGREYQYPKPGQAGDTTSRSKVRRKMDTVVDDPDVCEVAVSGKLDYKSGKKITAKIFNR